MGRASGKGRTKGAPVIAGPPHASGPAGTSRGLAPEAQTRAIEGGAPVARAPGPADGRGVHKVRSSALVKGAGALVGDGLGASSITGAPVDAPDGMTTGAPDAAAFIFPLGEAQEGASAARPAYEGAATTSAIGPS